MSWGMTSNHSGYVGSPFCGTAKAQQGRVDLNAAGIMANEMSPLAVGSQWLFSNLVVDAPLSGSS